MSWALLAINHFPKHISKYLKIAKVIDAFKKEDAEMTSNYRPISLLSSFSKLYTKFMYKNSARS